MKRLGLFIIMCWCIMMTASAQFPAGIIYLINDNFYKELPPSIKAEDITGINKMVDSDGNVFCELTLKPGRQLSKQELDLALPSSKVPNKMEILQRSKNPIFAAKTQPLFLIQGLFFKNKPSSLEGKKVGMVTLKTKNDNEATCLKIRGELTEADKKCAIPLEQVPHGKDFLEEAKKPQKFIYILREKDKMGAFSATDTKGKIWNNQNTLGKPLVLNFWYTGCGPCILEMPEISGWMKICPNVNYLAITWDTAAQIKRIVEKKQFLFHQIAGDQILWKTFDIRATPTTVVINKKGIICKIVTGTNQQTREELLELIKNLEKE